MKSRNIVSKNLAITFEKAFELTTNFDYLKKLDNGSNLALVPIATYLIKDFKTDLNGKIYTTGLIDSLGVTIADRINHIVAFCHFHPINSLSQKLVEKSLAIVKKEFSDAGGNVANNTLRVIGGQDEKVRVNIINGCKAIFTNCNIKIDNDFFNEINGNQSVHGIITSRGSYIAKLEQKTNEKIHNSEDIMPENYNIIKVFPENKEALFFTECQYIKNSDEQNRMNKRANLMIRKAIADLLKIDVTSNGSNIFYDLTSETYQELLKKDISKRLLLYYYYSGCGLVSVQNMMRMDKNRKLLPLVNQRSGAFVRKHFRVTSKK